MQLKEHHIVSTFSCPVVRVASVEDHSNADRLSIIRMEGLGYTAISAKLEDGTPRYRVGDLVVYIPADSVLPEWFLRDQGYWDEEERKGTHSGTNGDRVKPRRLRGVYSEGVLYKVCAYHVEGGWPEMATRTEMTGAWNIKWAIATENGSLQQVIPGDDAAEHLGITKYDPPVPVHMAGQCANLRGHLEKFDFERLESVPDIFDDVEWVTASEKLHGSHMCISFFPGLDHPEMFGSKGDIAVNSKGLGAQGLAFKNVPENRDNVYVKTLVSLLEQGLEHRLRGAVNQLTESTLNTTVTCEVPIRLFGEVYGTGIQDLHYGTRAPEFAVFDVRVGDCWLPRSTMEAFCAILGLAVVPLLYQGPFNLAALEAVRDGPTTLGGGHIREGIVVRAERCEHHPTHGRRISKLISPAYLLRKAKNATEYQ